MYCWKYRIQTLNVRCAGVLSTLLPHLEINTNSITRKVSGVLERLKSVEIVKVVIWNIHFEETHLNGFMQISAQQPTAWLHDSLVFLHRISRWLIVVELTYFI